jgi:ribosomal protein S18 acetylase RimI-like enzyme
MARVIHCICGERLQSGDDAGLFEVFRAHVHTAHPEFPVTHDDIRRTFDTWAGNERWDGERREVTEPIEVRALGVDTLDDFLAYFDRRAFMDNPFWFGCYCLEGHDIDPGLQPPSQNRETKMGFVRDGSARGFLAFVGGEPVGWCNAAPRSLLPGILHGLLQGTDQDPNERIGAIACFNVAAPYRGSGVGRTLLDAACEGLRAQGFDLMESYPRKGQPSEARSYRGPLSMYESAGFERHGETQHYLVMRKRL